VPDLEWWCRSYPAFLSATVITLLPQKTGQEQEWSPRKSWFVNWCYPKQLYTLMNELGSKQRSSAKIPPIPLTFAFPSP